MNKLELILNSANEAISQKNYMRAINQCKKVLKERPDHLLANLTLCEALLLAEKYEEALRICARTVELDGQNIKALNNFGAALIRTHKLSEAKEIYEYALTIEPKNVNLLINICNIYQAFSKPEESLKFAVRAIECDPTNFMAYNNLGAALGDLNMVNEAREAYLTSKTLNPNYLPTQINLAQLETKIGNHLDGIKIYESILKNKNVTKNYSDLIFYYLSYSYLTLGDLSKGWDYYDYGFSRLLPKQALRSNRKFIQPRWGGNLNEEKPILVWREQGLGDEILFSTCLADLHELDLKIIIECEVRLIDIFKRTYPKFNVRGESIDADGYPLIIDFEYQIAIGSLPRIFRRNIKSFERRIDVWHPKIDSVRLFKEKLNEYKDKILVGICWRSGQLSVDRNLNYTSIRDWGDLLANPKYQFVNLVHGDCESEIVEAEELFGVKILRWKDVDLKDDLEAVLALVSLLDCVVSVGTAVSVIAASSGVTTLLLIQDSWVLMGEKDKYPWYPNVKPFVVKVNEHVGININKLYPYMVKTK